MAAVSSLPIFARPPTLLVSPTRFKRISRLPIKCSSSPKLDLDPETPPQGGISTFTWCAGLGALGLVETGYLTYLKLTNTAAFCPVGGGSCSDVLNSDYAVVFGVPLPLIGLLAYGCVVVLGLQLSGKKKAFGLSESDGRLVLLGITTSMATASGYFLYLLGTKFSGTTCSYCLVSALLSFSLFFINLKDYGWEELRENVGIQLAIASIVVAALSNTYSTTQSAMTNLIEVDLLPYETEITAESNPFALSLANHLRSIGAKMYGAFWCSHCLEQKQMFGSEASKILDYVECFPDGVGKGRKIAKECELAKIEGFPTWVIKGKVYNGELTFPELMDASGFIEDFHPT